MEPGSNFPFPEGEAPAGYTSPGNTHFLMSDLNNVQVADLLSQYLAEKKLD